MSIKTTMHVALVAATVILLAACGGSGGTDNATNNPMASKPVVAFGTISGFGSVYVNGVRYDTNSATVIIDDQPGTVAQLKVGDVVRLTGRLNADGRNGTASSIECDDAVQGPVQSIDVTAGTLVVLSQDVKVDAATSFDDDIQPASLEGLAAGDIVEVSGFRDADGVIHATRIERADAGDDFEVTGTVANLDAAAKRFEIGALVVDYSAAQLDDLPAGEPANGLLVEVKGASLDANNVLLATRVEGEQDDMDVDDEEEAEIEGLITRFVSPTDFDVNGQPVTTTADTRFENGTSAHLALNVRVEVEGEVLNGVLQADEIEFEFEHEADLRASGEVGSVDAVAGTFTVLGITIETSVDTRFEDKTDAEMRPFNVAALQVGDFVEVRGVAGSVPDSIAATRVERNDVEHGDGEIKIGVRGPAANVAEPQLTILGVTVMADANTEYADGSDRVIDATEFFALAPGRLVSADGRLDGSVLVARKLEFEGENEFDD